MFAFIAKLFSMLTFGASAGEKLMIAADKYAGGAVIHGTKFEQRMELESGLEVEELMMQIEAKRIARQKAIAKQEKGETFDV